MKAKHIYLIWYFWNVL